MMFKNKISGRTLTEQEFQRLGRSHYRAYLLSYFFKDLNEQIDYPCCTFTQYLLLLTGEWEPIKE